MASARSPLRLVQASYCTAIVTVFEMITQQHKYVAAVRRNSNVREGVAIEITGYHRARLFTQRHWTALRN